MAELKIPTELVTLPSKGLLYPKESPLSKGEIEMKYMTAREEDILTNSNYIKNGTAIDKLLQALIITPVEFNDILTGDKDAIIIAARVLGYGKDYTFNYRGKDYTVDLSILNDKKVDYSLFQQGTNEFRFTTPKTGDELTFKLLTHGDETKIDAEISGLQKVNPNSSSDITTRLKHIITSVNGNYEQKSTRDYVDNYLLAPDARALRQYYSSIQPGIDMKFTPNDPAYVGEGIEFTPSLNFFWPDFGL